MSRVGNHSIAVPDKVKVSIADNHVAVEGPKGKLEMDMPRRTSVSQQENTLKVARDGADREAKALHERIVLQLVDQIDPSRITSAGG